MIDAINSLSSNKFVKIAVVVVVALMVIIKISQSQPAPLERFPETLAYEHHSDGKVVKRLQLKGDHPLYQALHQTIVDYPTRWESSWWTPSPSHYFVSPTMTINITTARKGRYKIVINYKNDKGKRVKITRLVNHSVGAVIIEQAEKS